MGRRNKMECRPSLTQCSVKQLRSAAMLWLALASIWLMGAQSVTAQDAAALRAACGADAQKLCAGVQPGGGRILACLKKHKDQISDSCKSALMGATQHSGGGSGSNSSSASSNSHSTGDSDSASSLSTPSAPAAAPTSRSSHATGTKPKNTSAASSGSYLRMKQVKIIAKVDDPSVGGKADIPAQALLIPSGWTLKGGVSGNTHEGCFSDIFALSWEATAPDGSLAFQGAPNDSWQYSDDPAELKKLNDPNRRALGLGKKPCPVKKPMKAEEYIRQNVLTIFPSGSTVVSVDPYPELNQIARKQLGLSSGKSGNNDGTQTDAVRARVKFKKDGKDLEDWVTAVVVTRTHGQGRGAFYDCHAIDIMALRAPEGQLDGNDKLFKVMISSIRREQKWVSFSNGFIAKLYQAEAQKEATQDQMIAQFQQWEAQVINDVTANSMRGANQAAFGEDQIIRGVQTFRDPTTGNTMELSNQYDHAWLNGQNEYVMSDDPNFNPNGQLNGDWNQLQLVQRQP